MISLSANVNGNSVTITDDALREYSGQQVIVTITEKKKVSEDFLKSQLDSLRTSSKSSWGEDAQTYLDNLRNSERVF